MARTPRMSFHETHQCSCRSATNTHGAHPSAVTWNNNTTRHPFHPYPLAVTHNSISTVKPLRSHINHPSNHQSRHNEQPMSTIKSGMSLQEIENN